MNLQIAPQGMTSQAFLLMLFMPNLCLVKLAKITSSKGYEVVQKFIYHPYTL